MGLFSIFSQKKVAYFPGCFEFYKFKESFELNKKILNRLGINYKILSKRICCGIPAFEAGYELEARRLARRNFEILKNEDIETLITSCPVCYKFFSNDYGELFPDWNIELINVYSLMLEKLMNKPKLIKVKAIESVIYLDNCYLGRGLNIYDEPRKVLEIIGYEVKELQNNHKESICSGSCGGLARTNPDLSNEIAKNTIIQAKRIGVKKIIVTSYEDYELLKENSVNESIDIIHFFEALGIAMGLKKIEDDESSKNELNNSTDIDKLISEAEEYSDENLTFRPNEEVY